MALTVNADDFGASESVNNAICLAFRKGLIDRTTLMTNMPAAALAMKTAEEEGFIDKVGIHINLTSGMPLTEQILHDPVMCDPKSGFTADFARNIKTRFFLPKKTCENIERELRAQLDRFGELGGRLWHIDSHHYVHTDPSVWRILKKVMKDYPVVSVRLGRNMYTGGNPLMRIYKIFLNSYIRKFNKGNPVYFGSAVDYAEYMSERPELLKKGDIEVMVHPKFDGEGRLADEFEDKFHELVRL